MNAPLTDSGCPRFPLRSPSHAISNSGLVFCNRTVHSDINVVTVLVGNKTDLKEAREVTTAEAKSLAEEQGLFFVETSALDSSNVVAAFKMVVEERYRILSRKAIASQELKKQDPSWVGNGKTGDDSPDSCRAPPKNSGCCSY
ncbi:hypothetical protein MLD38_040932 [Melastoma candidum]|nr:hypothetical protein MLD38_040932 [Melastoma candidum]